MYREVNALTAEYRGLKTDTKHTGDSMIGRNGSVFHVMDAEAGGYRDYMYDEENDTWIGQGEQLT